MKKRALLLMLTVLTILVIVSCGDTAPATSRAQDSSALPSNTAQAPDTTATADTTALLETTPVNSETTAPTTTPAETTAPETTVPETTVLETTVPETTVPETTASPITYTAKSWMGALPDATQLNQIAMPGTHDSGATVDYILSGTAKCQEATIAEQLAMGVRFLDIRLRRMDGELHVYHGYVDQKLTFDEVLSACYAFLAENPSETLMMSIKEEYDASGTNDPFSTMVAAKIREQASYWHISPAIPKLGDVRGKIVLMRRYSGTSNFGIDATSGWSDNTTFTLNTSYCLLSVQDYYNNSSADAKWSAVAAMFKKMNGQKNVYYLNFTSGYVSSSMFGMDVPNINTVKNAVNPKLIEYLKTSPDFVGMVIVDFVTPEIAELIYEVNFK